MNLISKAFIYFFIVFQLLVMGRQFVQFESIDHYLSFFSFYQKWNMFAPDPMGVNSFLTAEVEYDDGSKTYYNFPRSSELGRFDRTSKGERYRVLNEFLIREEAAPFWKDTAKFVLRKTKSEAFHKIPMRVHLIRNWNKISPPEEKFISHTEIDSSYNSFKFFTHEVF